MKHLLFSDVHSNLEALEGLLAHISEEKPDKIFFLGDVVGYGANPSECLQTVADMADLCLAGNHDVAAAGILATTYFNPLAKEVIFWTQSQLSAEEIAYLKTLPVILQFPEFCLVHSSPWQPDQWNYIITKKDAADNFPYFSSSLCFIGHSHRAEIFILDQSENCRISLNEAIEVKENYRYIVNVGSVGQPRDNNPQAAYCLYDDQKKYIQIHRFDYNIQKAQQKIIQADLPHFLAERLSLGI